MNTTDDQSNGEMTTFKQVLAVKTAIQEELMAKANVLGVGIGYHQFEDELGETIALIVLVREKKPLTELNASDIIPKEIDGVPIVIRAVGSIRAQG